MLSRSRPPLTLPEYERLFRIIHAVVENEGGDSSKACLFFGIAGAHLLSSHHRFKTARLVAGIAGYNLRTPTNLSIVLGKVEGGELLSNEDHFHCWIEVDGWIIDFTAPLFDEMAPAERKGAAVPRLMFQKPVLAGARSFDGLNTPGAYIHVPNAELTAALMIHFAQKPAHSDLIGICEQWHVRPPKKMAPSVGIGDQHGNLNEVRLSRIRVEGAW
ncbi:MAG: hypothetical protein A2522_05835 [Gallionellales bacterium RIFOXYD12_FULL_53_10]|nr:MAG: hypothetical protein A2522_05835 [Gallionellales bacterium RIFOXYD12_FULL_53_10]HLD63895.1 DUF2026 family protein [Candidatus Peribacteraceae bacterium]